MLPAVLLDPNQLGARDTPNPIALSLSALFGLVSRLVVGPGIRTRRGTEELTGVDDIAVRIGDGGRLDHGSDSQTTPHVGEDRGQLIVLLQQLDQLLRFDAVLARHQHQALTEIVLPHLDVEIVGGGDRRAYQQDPANRRESLREVELDVAEGADIVMVKPAVTYLDVIADVAAIVDVPVAAYHVSGEYSMIKAAAERGWIDGTATAVEQLTAVKRAGADIILTYFAGELAPILDA